MQFYGAACIHFVRKELLIKHQLFPRNTYHEDEAFVTLAYFYAQKRLLPIGIYMHIFNTLNLLLIKRRGTRAKARKKISTIFYPIYVAF